eukprot:8143197-Lingulodinium_polyedra.AAC.1
MLPLLGRSTLGGTSRSTGRCPWPPRIAHGPQGLPVAMRAAQFVVERQRLAKRFVAADSVVAS